MQTEQQKRSGDSATVRKPAATRQPTTANLSQLDAESSDIISPVPFPPPNPRTLGPSQPPASSAPLPAAQSCCWAPGRRLGRPPPTPHLLESLGPVTLLALVGDSVMERLQSIFLLSDLRHAGEIEKAGRTEPRRGPPAITGGRESRAGSDESRTAPTPATKSKLNVGKARRRRRRGRSAPGRQPRRTPMSSSALLRLFSGLRDTAPPPLKRLAIANEKLAGIGSGPVPQSLPTREGEPRRRGRYDGPTGSGTGAAFFCRAGRRGEAKGEWEGTEAWRRGKEDRVGRRKSGNRRQRWHGREARSGAP